jgi:integrase
MSVQPSLDAAGRRRSPATMPGFRAGIAPRNKGQSYPADPPTVDEIVAVMRQAGHDRHGHRLTALIVVLWRAGLRINEALSLTETDLDGRRGSVLVRHGKNDRRREVGMDAWGWTAIEPRLADRPALPVGPLFCVIDGPTRGRAWSDSATRVELRHLALNAGVRRRFAPHQLRHAHAVELIHEGIPLPLIQRQLGHSPPLNDRHLSRGDQQRGDHLHRPRTARADDARKRGPRPLTGTRGSAAALPHRPPLSGRAAVTHQRCW